MIRELTAADDVPAEVQQAFGSRASNDGFVLSAARTMLATFSEQPRGDDPHLTWSRVCIRQSAQWHFNQTSSRGSGISTGTPARTPRARFSTIGRWCGITAMRRSIASMDRNRRNGSPDGDCARSVSFDFPDDSNAFEAASHFSLFESKSSTSRRTLSSTPTGATTSQ